MDDLSANGKPKVYVHQLEFFDGCVPIEEGFEYSVDSLSMKTKHTHGHSLGGMTYIIDGLAKPVAVVGDAMFAGSMGGGMISYSGCIANKSRENHVPFR